MRLSSASVTRHAGRPSTARTAVSIVRPANQGGLHDRPHRFTRRSSRPAPLAGAALIGAPLPLRFASAHRRRPTSRSALLLPTSGVQAQIGQACRRGADIANDVFADMKMPVKLDIVNYDTETKPDVARTQAEKAIDAGCHMLVGAFDSGQTIAIAQVAEQTRRAAGRQHRRRAADHRAGLQVHRAQLPDGADADHRRASTCTRRSSRSRARRRRPRC